MDRGAVRDLLGHCGEVDYVAARALRSCAKGIAGVPATVPLWQPYGVPPRVPCDANSGARLAETAEPARVPGQRAHAGRHRPIYSLAPRDWRIDYGGSRARDAIGCNMPSLNEPEKGGASSGRDTTARLFQGRQAPSLTCFVVYSLLFSADYEAACTGL